MTTPTGPGITAPQAASYYGAVRQQNPVGQNLGGNPNVYAPAGMGGDVWGANGGDQNPVGGGATDQTGYVKSVIVTPSSCESATNYMDPGVGTTNAPSPNTTRLARMNSDALPGQTQDPLTSAGNNAG